MKNKIYTIGGTGLVGSNIYKILSLKYDIDDLAYENGFDITKPETLDVLKKDKNHNYIILYAAKTDVDSCEKDKSQGINGDAYKINVGGVENIIKITKNTNKTLIYISTDFVFNGKNTLPRGYTEKDKPDPVNWYAQTKYLGEQQLRKSGQPYIIIRIAYPFCIPASAENKINPAGFIPKKDIVEIFKSRLQNNLPVKALTDHITTPTFIDDIARSLDILIEKAKTGIYHITGSQSLTPYEIAMQIAAKFKLNKSLITGTTRAEFFKDRAPRPFNLTMNNDKISTLGVKMLKFEEGLDKIKKYIK